MNRISPILILTGLVIASGCRKVSPVQTGNALRVPRDAEEETVLRLAAHVVPSRRQLAWQEMEYTAFVHFGINTFTDREWGEGNEDPSLFDPSEFDANQWARVFRKAGMKMIILTAKHHDGFCLWPSAYTDHSVKRSQWKNGKGDVVGEVAEACRKAGLTFGFYLSPWDRHERSYGDSPRYNRYFLNQLTELLTRYGKISEVWFDGACAEGPNGKRQVYDWQAYYDLVRKLQPDAVIAIMGPDVRWVGTESGYGRQTEWSVIPMRFYDPEKRDITAHEAVPEDTFIPQDLVQEDLGSREAIRNASLLAWYPSEVDVSIRPGWFYHASQDGLVKSPEKLLDIYFSSVGRNSVLLLNCPPDRRGLIHENDARALAELRRGLDEIFSVNLAKGSRVRVSGGTAAGRPRNVIDADRKSFWMADSTEVKPWLEFDLGKEKTFDVLLLEECIRLGQRMEAFSLQALIGDAWETVAAGTTVGYRRILRFPQVTASKVRLVIESSRLAPAVSSFGLYKNLPSLEIIPQSAVFEDSLRVVLRSDGPRDALFYSLDDRDPVTGGSIYQRPLLLDGPAIVRAEAVDSRGVRSFEKWSVYRKAVYRVSCASPPSPRYAEGNPLRLADGETGSLNFNDGKWVGFEGVDMRAVVDLGETRDVSDVSVGFLQAEDQWIFFPSSLTVELSQDGKNYRISGTVDIPAAPLSRTERKNVGCRPGSRARFVRISARNIGSCPAWHPGAGGKAWIFSDEIVVQRGS